MTKEEFIDLIKRSDPQAFARHRLFDEGCWIFTASVTKVRGTYSEFRGEIADLLDVNPRAVAIIGSAKFGWSMSPEKIGNPFDPTKSDIDIVIVSNELFDSSWRQILQAYYNGYDALRRDHSRQIFSKFVVISSNLASTSEYLRDLRIRLTGLNRIVNSRLSIENRAKYRIYRDWNDVELYHTKGVAELQRSFI